MLLDANIFQPLIDVFAAVLKFFHNNVGVSWGFSIILLTICVRLVLMPLTIKQFHSMRRMQQLQPQISALKERYKNDKQRQQQEQMKLFQEAGVNPLASCLPMVAQLPVFISLFYMLREQLRTDICPAIQTRFQVHYAMVNHVSREVAKSQTTQCTYYGNHVPAASFLFIKDITDQAHGAVLIILCLLYVGTQMASSLLMSAPTMDKNQRRMMTFLPVFFVLFIIRFPAGLLVYWITTNTWTMAQQFTLKRLIGAPMIAEATDIDVPASSSSSKSSGRQGSGRLMGPDPLTPTRPSGPGRISSLFTPKTSQPSSSNGNDATSVVGGAGTRTTPPPPPRKKKKRSGRRR